MMPDEVSSTMANLVNMPGADLVSTIRDLKAALGAGDAPPIPPSNTGFVIRERSSEGTPASVTDVGRGKGKEPLVSRKRTKNSRRLDNAPGSCSYHDATLMSSALSTPPIDPMLPNAFFASQSPLPPVNIPPRTPTPTPTHTPISSRPIPSASASHSTPTSTPAESTTSNMQVRGGIIFFDAVGQSFNRRMRQLLDIYLPGIHLNWR